MYLFIYLPPAVNQWGMVVNGNAREERERRKMAICHCPVFSDKNSLLSLALCANFRLLIDKATGTDTHLGTYIRTCAWACACVGGL